MAKRLSLSEQTLRMLAGWRSNSPARKSNFSLLDALWSAGIRLRKAEQADLEYATAISPTRVLSGAEANEFFEGAPLMLGAVLMQSPPVALLDKKERQRTFLANHTQSGVLGCTVFDLGFGAHDFPRYDCVEAMREYDNDAAYIDDSMQAVRDWNSYFADVSMHEFVLLATRVEGDAGIPRDACGVLRSVWRRALYRPLRDALNGESAAVQRAARWAIHEWIAYNVPDSPALLSLLKIDKTIADAFNRRMDQLVRPRPLRAAEITLLSQLKTGSPTLSTLPKFTENMDDESLYEAASAWIAQSATATK